MQGRERIYLDRFYNECPPTRSRSTRKPANTYAALYAKPHAMHDAFEQFGAFNQDAIDNQALLAKASSACRCSRSGPRTPSARRRRRDLHFVASNVTGGIVPNSGHWIMRRNPKATIKLVTEFLRLENSGS